MKKICFITTISLTLKTFVLKTAEYIHNHTDWDISFICSEDNDFSESLPDYIHYYPVHMDRGVSIAGVKAMLQMVTIFRREKFDLIQYSTPNASLYASLAGVLARVPVRLYCQWGIAFVGFHGMKKVIFKNVERMVCALSTWIEPDSDSNLKFSHAQKLYAENKGSVIWNGSACGVDLRKFDIEKKSIFREEVHNEYAIPEEAFVYGFVGRVNRDKGVNELLEAFRRQPEECFLVMVGPSEVDQSINSELYHWSKNCGRVIYTGYTNCVEKYLSAMDCYILPSYREGFGMGVIEAEAMGVPVIVTNIQGPIDAMLDGKTGIIVEKGNVSQLSSAMEKMRQEKNSYYGENGRRLAVECFDQEKLFQFLLSDRKRLLCEE